MDITIKRALISVSDKRNLDSLAEALTKNKIQIISTGGTAAKLKELGHDVTEISEYTGAPEIMDGRVKTLHPKVHGGLLACLDKEHHVKAMSEHGIESINLVVVNLYPFEETVARDASFDEVIEQIDIGGPSMVRSAAKNYMYTTIVTDPSDYQDLIAELNQNKAATTLEFRHKLAAKAFSQTARYDAAIANWFASQNDNLAPTLHITADLKQSLRYGENPHQEAAFYSTDASQGIAAATQLQGKELSYNNIHDADAALQLVMEFNNPAAVIIKHTNPCGAATGKTIEEAYDKALASDSVSAFGGILAFNQTVTPELAEKLSSMFVEAIIAPDVAPEAKKLFAKKKNLRVLTLPLIQPEQGSKAIKSIQGGLLVQDLDLRATTNQDLQVVSKRQPSAQELLDLLFAFKVCKHVKSNAIVLASNNATVGVGAGQMSRVDSVKIAVEKANTLGGQDNLRANGSVLASDAFFPFADGIENAAKAGVTAIIQPGGSIRDDEVIKAADDHGMAMVLTGIRHFRH